MADIDSKLKGPGSIEDIFGDDLERIPTTGTRTLKQDVFDALLLMFSVRDEDLNLDGFKGDKAAAKVKSQAPYKAMAHMLVMLAKGAETED